MPLGTPAPPNIKRKKPSKIITDLALALSQDEQEPEELDLGIKVRTPKDIMLEELSLQKNRGSKMFKMRQIRVEKFIYENNPDLFSSESMENFQKFVPSLGGQMMMNVGGNLLGSAGGTGGGAPVVPPKPGSKGAGAGLAGGAGGPGGPGGPGGAGGPGGVSGAGGVTGSGGPGGHGGSGAGGGWTPLKGGGGTDIHVKMYMSPWEKAMKGDAALTATLKATLDVPDPKADLILYKSFNRTAMPFGGYEKANALLKFQLPDIEASKEPEPAAVFQSEARCRPSFNRTPIGWVGNNEPNSSIHMETDAVPFDGETDEL